VYEVLGAADLDEIALNIGLSEPDYTEIYTANFNLMDDPTNQISGDIVL
jgi:hypothetical protein